MTRAVPSPSPGTAKYCGPAQRLMCCGLWSLIAARAPLLRGGTRSFVGARPVICGCPALWGGPCPLGGPCNLWEPRPRGDGWWSARLYHAISTAPTCKGLHRHRPANHGPRLGKAGLPLCWRSGNGWPLGNCNNHFIASKKTKSTFVFLNPMNSDPKVEE